MPWVKIETFRIKLLPLLQWKNTTPHVAKRLGVCLGNMLTSYVIVRSVAGFFGAFEIEAPGSSAVREEL